MVLLSSEIVRIKLALWARPSVAGLNLQSAQASTQKAQARSNPKRHIPSKMLRRE
jgi:hypothetical protein